MTTTSPAINIQHLSARVAALEAKASLALVTENSSGDGATATFASMKGVKPFAVFVAGVLQREGAGEDYTLTFNGFVWSTVFAVAPGSVDVTRISQRIA